MSMLTDNMDYNNSLLMWKLQSKKDSDSPNIQVLTPLTTVPTSHITNVPSTLTQMTDVVPMQITQFTTPIPNNQPKPVENIILQTNKTLNETAEKKATKKKFKNVAGRATVKKKIKDGMAYHSQQLGLKVPPKKTLGIKGMVIHTQAREVIHNVYKFMKNEAQNGSSIPIANYRERVLAATGISKCTYSKITTREFFHGDFPSIRRKKLNHELKVDSALNDGQTSENDSLYRPKINRNASTRDGVYNLEDVVPSNILNTLLPEASKISSIGTVENYGLCPFAAASISNILLSSSPAEVKLRSITIFLYIHYLIKFINTPMKNVTKRFVVCDTSMEVNQHILDNFAVATPNGRTRPLHMKDKCLCYIIVLAAIGMEYEVNIELLSKDLKIGVKKAVELSRILAFNSSAKNKSVVTLKLPLPAPVNYNPRRKMK